MEMKIQKNGKGGVAMAIAVLLGTLGLAAHAAQPARGSRAAQPAAPAPAQLVVEHVRGNVYMIGGAGGNITVQIGNEGVLIVDSGLVQNAEAVLAELRKLSDRKLDYIINTHYHSDHTGGNAIIAPTGQYVGGVGIGVAPRAAIWAHENVLNRVSAVNPNTKEPMIPGQGWPIETYFTASQDLFFNDEPIS